MSDIQTLMEQAEKARAQLAELEEKVNQARADEASTKFIFLKDEIAQFKEFWSTAQRDELVALLSGKKRKARKSKEGGKVVVAKFELPTGATWAGRGKMPTAFLDWDASEEGKAWHKANPKQRYPFAKGYEPTEEDRNWDPKAHEARLKEQQSKEKKSKEKKAK